jgi:hypothetical protein
MMDVMAVAHHNPGRASRVRPAPEGGRGYTWLAHA